MSDNIAHDLRSPIARIRGMAEVTLTTGKSLGEYENMAASTIEDCDRLLDMINTMLLISKTEAGVEKPSREEVDIAALIRKACELFQPIAEDKNVGLELPRSGENLTSWRYPNAPTDALQYFGQCRQVYAAGRKG